MAEKKNQHFVPKFLLRKFSDDGKSLALVLLSAGKIVRGASLTNQCAKDYFYGRDSAVEDAFAAWEGEIAATVRNLDPHVLQNLPFDKLYQLRQYAHYQHRRTEGAAEMINSMVDNLGKAILKESPNGSLPNPHDVRLGLKEPQHLSLYNAATSTPFLLDLAMKFLVRSEPPGFVTSDDPVVLSNQWAEHHPKFTNYRGVTGLALKGLQMFLPLSPQVTLAVFDQQTYRCGNSASLVRHVSADDANRLNKLQVLHAMKCIYYNPIWSPNMDPAALRDFKAAAPKREWATEVGPKEHKANGTIRQLVVSIAPDVRIGGTFDFMPTTDADPYDGYDRAVLPVRSQVALKLADEYQKYVDAKLSPGQRRKRRR